MTNMFNALLAGTALALMGAPALADVKSGVEAWDSGQYTAAVKAWRPLAVKGDADAQFNLAQAYRFGRGVPVDLKMAEDWYRKAAVQGHEQAEDALGLTMFQNGDRANALPYIKRSADRGEPRAQFVYGSVLFNGDIIGKDWPKAYGYMTRSSSSGFAKASSALAQMDQVIPLDQRQQGMAVAQQIEANAARAKLPTQMAMATPEPIRAREVSMPAAMPAAPGWEMEAPSAAVAVPVTKGIRKEELPPSSADSMPGRRGVALPSPRTSRADRAEKSKPVEDAVVTDLPPAPDYTGGADSSYPGSTGMGVGMGATYPNELPAAAAGGDFPGASYPSTTYPGTSSGAAYPATSSAPSYPGASYPSPTSGTSYPAYPVETAAPAPVVKAAPAASGGGWRIQLGAFSQQGRAQALGQSLKTSVPALNGKQFYVVNAGPLTRLQAGGYASRGEAESACSAVRASGNVCSIVAR